MTAAVEHDQIVEAIAWCRLGSSKSTYPGGAAFIKAKELGLLAQDPIWRATPQGEGVLIAAGLLDGEPAPETTRVCVLWAQTYYGESPSCSVVGAFAEGMVEFWPQTYESQRIRLEETYRSLVEDDVSFFTTSENIQRPKSEQ